MNHILKIPTKILIRKFNIDFSYVTNRGNKRLRTLEIRSTDPQEAEYRLHNWIAEYNIQYPQKPYSNVKILGYEEIDRELNKRPSPIHQVLDKSRLSSMNMKFVGRTGKYLCKKHLKEYLGIDGTQWDQYIYFKSHKNYFKGALT